MTVFTTILALFTGVLTILTLDAEFATCFERFYLVFLCCFFCILETVVNVYAVTLSRIIVLFIM